MNKNQVRQLISKKRNALAPEWLEIRSAQLTHRLQSTEAFHSAKIVALYKAIGGEVCLESLFTTCWKRGQRTCIPVFNEQGRYYQMAEITPATPFIIGNYGIQEPQNPDLLNLNEIDLIAVPGVAFDCDGNRLGRGGGYYDRMLSQFKGMSVGITFDFQVLSQIPSEKHDQPVDFVITETNSLNVPNER